MPDGARFAFRASPRVILPSTAPKCPSCEKSVYAAEQVMGPGGAAYHKSCLRCTSCGRTLDALNLFEHGHDPYCKMCHSKAFGTKGVGYGNAVVGEYAVTTSPTFRQPATELPPLASPASHSRAPSQDLNRRAGTVSPLSAKFSRFKLEDEKPQAALKIDRRLLQDDDFDAPSHPSPPQPQIPSNTHPSSSKIPTDPRSVPTPYQASDHTPEPASSEETDEFEPAPLSSFPIFTVKSRGLAPQHTVQPDAPVPKENPKLSRPLPTSSTWTAPTPRPFSSIARAPSLAPSFSARTFFDDKPVPASKPTRSASVRVSASVPAGSLGIKTIGSPSILDLGSHDGPKLCPRCSTTVYHAEQVLALGKKWHKRCLRCCKCSKALDAGMCERDGIPYCSKCYDQDYGIEAKGFVLRPGFVGR